MDVTAPVPHAVRTARVLLRPWCAADAPALLPVLEANAAHLGPWIPPHVARAVPLAELAQRLDDFGADFRAGRAWRYAVLSLDERQVLGEADLFPRAATGRVPFPEADRVEIGYWLASAVTGQGLATEAARALLDLARALPGMTRAEIRCDAANAPSAAVPRRLGLELTAVEGDLQVWSMPLGSPGS